MFARRSNLVRKLVIMVVSDKYPVIREGFQSLIGTTCCRRCSKLQGAHETLQYFAVRAYHPKNDIWVGEFMSNVGQSVSQLEIAHIVPISAESLGEDVS